MKYILATILFFMIFSVSAKNLVITAVIDTVLPNENVTYKVTQDANNIHLKISTSDEKTMLSMVRLGVTVFFDIKGKKKQKVYVTYPSEAMASKTERRNREEITQMDIESEEKSGNIFKEILENDYSQKAEYIYFDDREEFNIHLNTVNIEVAFNYDPITKSLVYSLTIPKNKINKDNRKDLSKLTIGVKTVKEKKKDSNTNGSNRNIGQVRMGGQRRGQGRGTHTGVQGSRDSGDSRGGQSGGQPNSGEQTKPTDVLLDFWFDVSGGM